MNALANPFGVGPRQKPIAFWRFAGPVLAGNFAALGAGWVARRALSEESPGTRTAAAAFSAMGAFWLVGGLTWLALTKGQHE